MRGIEQGEVGTSVNPVSCAFTMRSHPIDTRHDSPGLFTWDQDLKDYNRIVITDSAVPSRSLRDSLTLSLELCMHDVLIRILQGDSCISQLIPHCRHHVSDDMLWPLSGCMVSDRRLHCIVG